MLKSAALKCADLFSSWPVVLSLAPVTVVVAATVVGATTVQWEYHVMNISYQ